jgi:hypothetical protein
MPSAHRCGSPAFLALVLFGVSACASLDGLTGGAIDGGISPDGRPLVDGESVGPRDAMTVDGRHSGDDEAGESGPSRDSGGLDGGSRDGGESHDAGSREAGGHDAGGSHDAGHDAGSRDAGPKPEAGAHGDAGAGCPGEPPLGECDDRGQMCDYPGTACICASEGVAVMMWSCATNPPQCPQFPPVVGSTCTQAGLVCNYGHCNGGPEVECTANKWANYLGGPCPG